MDKVFVVKNQQNLYLSKQQEWVDGADSQSLYRTQHRDEAINTVFEVSSRDIYLRAEALACAVDAKNNPVVEVGGQSQLPIDSTAVDTDEPAAETPEAESHSDSLADCG
jgi:hypothetical protein